MAILLAATLGALTGALTASLIVRRRLTIRYDLCSYERLGLHATRVRNLYQLADSEHRARVRNEARADELRDYVGELLDQIAGLLAERETPHYPRFLAFYGRRHLEEAA